MELQDNHEMSAHYLLKILGGIMDSPNNVLDFKISSQ